MVFLKVKQVSLDDWNGCHHQCSDPGRTNFQKYSHIEIAEKLHHIDKAILALFVIELITKMSVGGAAFFKRGWNIFDFVIIVGSFFYHHDYLPILRAFRVLHLMSFMDASPRMLHIISGLWRAMPGILNVFSILILFFYIAMKTMFQVLTGDDWSNIMKNVEKLTPMPGLILSLFM
jgi:hypothetical protein